MSQVGISARPATQQSLPTGRLPEIQHPLSRLGSPGKLNVRGVSRCGSRSGSMQSAPGSGRPVASEGGRLYTPYRRGLHSSAGRQSRQQQQQPPPLVYDSIPEGVEVQQGDPTKTRLPVFGNRADMGSRDDMASRVSSRMSRTSAQLRLEIDELEALVKEKMKTGYSEIRKKFRDNDPENKGNVSREAFMHILMTSLSKPMSNSQCQRLVQRLGFKDRQVIGFTEFFSQFHEASTGEPPKWLDPIQRQWQDRGHMTASLVHMHLKEKAKDRSRDIVEAMAETNPNSSGRLPKPEFRRALQKMGYTMTDSEYEKLWKRYDSAGTELISLESLMKKLNASDENGTTSPAPIKTPSDTSEETFGEGRKLRKKELDRQRSLNIERWLKDKFREGFQGMKKAFEAYDTEKKGMVKHKQFLEVLEKCGLKLDFDHLAEFLARCNVDPTNKEVPYRDFLHRFQDRSEDGMPHKILTNPKHPYNRSDSPTAKSTMSSLEAQIMSMFQRDFLALLGTFHKIDRLGLDAISQEEFRAAIESRFELEMDDVQFQSLIDRVPLDADGNVRYADFMAQFDTRGQAVSLFGQPSEAKKYKMVEALPRDPTPTDDKECDGQRKQTIGEEATESDRLMIEHADPEKHMVDIVPKRSTQELTKIIRDLMKRDYQRVDEEFHNLDEKNTQRLTQEMMYQLLKRMNIEPEITRGEIRNLWYSLITNHDKTLDFMEFIRKFAYSQKSASFPNAKVRPPVHGDSDFMMRSRKLNSTRDLLLDNLRAKVDCMWDDLHREFVAMDPYATGCVSVEEFQDIMSEMVVNLTNYELEMITTKFMVKGDDRVSYIEFLKPFAMKRQVWRHGNDLINMLQHPPSEFRQADFVQPTGLHAITAKLRQQVSDWKVLRRAFRKADINNTGMLALTEFRTVLQATNVSLDEDEVYHLMSHFDNGMTGKIPYEKFLDETVRPCTRRSVRSSANF